MEKYVDTKKFKRLTTNGSLPDRFTNNTISNITDSNRSLPDKFNFDNYSEQKISESDSDINSSKDITEETIFKYELKRTIISNDGNKQQNLLSIIPIFKFPVSMIFEVWGNIYKSTIKKYNKTCNKKYILRKLNIIRFFNYIIRNNLIKNIKIDKLLLELEELDDDNNILNNIRNKININNNKNINIINKKRYYNNKKIFKQFDFHLLQFNSITIAKEFTRKCAKYMNNISSVELLYYAMAKDEEKNCKIKFPYFVKLINYNDKINYWIKNEILFAINNLDRINKFKKIIEIALTLKDMNNFLLTFTFIASLNNPLLKIDNLWNDSKTVKYLKKLNKLEESFSVINNFKNYKNCLEDKLNQNMIPYYGVILNEIVHAIEKPIYDVKSNGFTDAKDKISNIIKKFQLIKFNYNIDKNNSIASYFKYYNLIFDDKTLEIKYNNINLEEHLIFVNNIINNLIIYNINDWDYDDVKYYLDIIGFKEYSNKFRKYKINGKILIDLISDDYKNYGIKKLGHRLKLQKYVRFISSNGNKSKNNNTINNIIIKYVNDWTIDEVYNWLLFIGFNIYGEQFLLNKIDGNKLTNLESNDLIRLGILNPKNREQLLNCINILKKL